MNFHWIVNFEMKKFLKFDDNSDQNFSCKFNSLDLLNSKLATQNSKNQVKTQTGR